MNSRSVPSLEGTRVTQERPTGNLRWRHHSLYAKPTLQQEWEIIEYYELAPTIRNTEWRFLPDFMDLQLSEVSTSSNEPEASGS